MTYIQAGVLGLVQGLTEFLPVSSSGHLIFIPKLLGWADQGVAFDLVIHLGTLAAIVLYFRQKLWALATIDRRLGWMIVCSAVPAAVVGLWLETNERNALLVAVNLIVWGVVLGVADYWSKRKNYTQAVSGKNILAMSLTQVLALIPGTSRSGITITAGLFSGLSRRDAAEMAFLMSVPITTLAGAHALYKVWEQNFAGFEGGALAVGFGTAFLSGLLAIGGLLKIVQRWSFTPFVVYRVIVGVFILWYLI